MSRSRPTMTAVIVTYNSRPEVGSALSALRPLYEAGELECVLVDNASYDGTAAFVTDAFPWVILVRSERNLGYGRGCNLGFEHVRTPYVLVQNPDAVVDGVAVRRLVDFFERHETAGIAAPAILQGGMSLQSAGLMTTPMTLVRSALRVRPTMPDQKRIYPGSAPFQTSWVCGAAMLIRSELFRRLGGFDPRFFLYFEETDLCRRATREGAEIWAVGEAQAAHVGGASASATGDAMESSCISDHFYRSRFYYLVKHFGWFPAVTGEVLLRMSETLRAWRRHVIGQKLRPNGSPARPFLKLPALPDDIS